MPYAKYTRELLAEAVTASTSMAGVLRHLGLDQAGGAHAHLRRRIDRLGIDTTHVLGRAHYRGTTNPRRRAAAEVLVVRAADAKREVPSRLRRALIEAGRPYRCAGCGGDGTWNGQPLTLHVDHIDGRAWDCRAENLRFLCPNCHSQTETFAGRSRFRVYPETVPADRYGNPVASRRPAEPLDHAQRTDVIERLNRKEFGVAEAARRMGCSRSRIYELQKRLLERGSLAPSVREVPERSAAAEAIVAFALDHPQMGARRIAQALKAQGRLPADCAPHRVEYVLTQAGLGDRAKRTAAAAAPRGGVSV